MLPTCGDSGVARVRARHVALAWGQKSAEPPSIRSGCWAAVITGASVRGLPPRAQEPEELHSFAETPLHHLRAHQHLAHDGGDLWGAEIEALVEIIHRPEDLGVTEM